MFDKRVIKPDVAVVLHEKDATDDSEIVLDATSLHVNLCLLRCEEQSAQIGVVIREIRPYKHGLSVLILGEKHGAFALREVIREY